MLHLIEQDIIHVPVGHSAVDMVNEGVGVAQGYVSAVFEVDLNYVVVGHSILAEIVVEELEKQIRLAATAQAGDDFDKAVVSPVD